MNTQIIKSFYGKRCETHKNCGWRASSWFSQQDQDYRFKCVLNYLCNENSILDIGCGQGDILNHINPIEYLGYDICPEMIEYAKQKFPNANFSSVLEKQSFDVALAIGTFSLKIENNYEYLYAEIKKMLEMSKKAIIVISIENHKTKKSNFPFVFLYNVEEVLKLVLQFTENFIMDNHSLPYETILCLNYNNPI